ncbi:hypothetical protein N7537_010579 [Penicillium hordei]|uniref:Uncharacterized protein n=1 Tax=Penicillium hordei TaxID=40994 RepID=A0AAD6DUW5_9EURO|nr:uncharacterized protein N7537_010579 [Penicillium hordei]KAJ5593675.1 hypothetical protein N7537_010579 [Penicillium hordei]
MGGILADSDRLQTVIVLDADKTLAQEDSGVLFWEQVRAASAEDEINSPLKALFNNPLGYSYTAFRQATLLYEEALGDVESEACCETVSSLIHMHSDIKDSCTWLAERDMSTQSSLPVESDLCGRRSLK